MPRIVVLLFPLALFITTDNGTVLTRPKCFPFCETSMQVRNQARVTNTMPQCFPFCGISSGNGEVGNFPAVGNLPDCFPFCETSFAPANSDDAWTEKVQDPDKEKSQDKIHVPRKEEPKASINKILNKFQVSEAEVSILLSQLEEARQEDAWVKAILEPEVSLLVIDMQNDFISGSLKVTGADDLLSQISDIVDDEVWDQIFYSKDWHTENHISFHSNVALRELHQNSSLEQAKLFHEVVFDEDPPYPQMLWPTHCVQSSAGSDLHKNLRFAAKAHLVEKGRDPEIDSYSAFYDNTKKLGAGSTGLDKMVAETTEIVVVGLALDFCVGFTSLDSLHLGIPTTIIKGLTKPVAKKTGELMVQSVESEGGWVTDFKNWKGEYGSWERAKQLADFFISKPIDQNRDVKPKAFHKWSINPYLFQYNKAGIPQDILLLKY